MRKIFLPFISISASIAVNCVVAQEITTDKQLEEKISSLNVLAKGVAGIVVNNSNSTPLTLTLNPNGVSVEKINSVSGEAYGIYATGKMQVVGSLGKELNFNPISSQKAGVYGIKSSDLVLDGVSLTYESLSIVANNVSNSDVRGIDSQANQGLNLTLKNQASIRFKSITSSANFAYTSGIATGYGGASSNIDLSGGKIVFDKISGVENAVGLAFQATTNTFSGDVVFSLIQSTGELTFGGKPISRNAYGISFAPSASATFNKNSRIYITSMDSQGNICPLFAQQSLSLTFEENAGLIYGAISESEKNNSYGIYAKTDKTLNYYFGAGDPSGTPPVDLTKAKGTTFTLLKSSGDWGAYGMYLQTTTQLNFNINGQAVFEKIQSDLGNAYGIYASGSMVLAGVAAGEKKLNFVSVVSQNGDAVGLGIAEDSIFTFGDGSVQIVFGGISGNREYAIKNQGTIIINQPNSLVFGSFAQDQNISGYAIGNTLDNLFYENGEIKVGDGSTSIALQYGFYNTAVKTSFDGNLAIRKFDNKTTNPFSLIYYGGTKAGEMDISNLSVSAYGNQSDAELLGFNATQELQLVLQNTLDITLMDEAYSSQYEAITTPRSEGVAFGENISLKLGENAKLVFNANGGKLKNLSNIGGEKGGAILLAGEMSGIGELTNRIWQDSNQNRNFNARHLEIENLQTQGAKFIVYADKDAKLANYTEQDVFGMAYTNQANTLSNRTSLGGSDSISISLNSAQQVAKSVSNDLVIALGGLNESNKSVSQNVVLAIVDESVKDQVIFNGLTKSGDSAIIKSYSGADVFDLEIRRFDDIASGDSFYYSNLVAYNSRIDTQYLISLSNSLNINFFTLSGNLNSLSKRLGDLKNEGNANGIWGRVFGGEQIMDFGVQTSQSYMTAQVGYDYGIDVSDAKNYIGVALSYSYASSIQDEIFYRDIQGVEGYKNSAKTHGVEVALYNTYQGVNGLYSDSIAKIGYLSSDINLYKDIAISGYSNLAFMLSEEIGYEFGLGINQEWVITPQGELAYAFMDQGTPKGKLGGELSIKTQDLHLLRMRVGASWGYRFNNVPTLDKIKALVYMGLYYEYDGIFGGDMTFVGNLSSKEYNDLCSNGRFTLNLGTDIQINKMVKLYFDFEKSFGNKMYKNYQVNLGARFSFGEKIRVLQDERDKTVPLSISTSQSSEQNKE